MNPFVEAADGSGPPQELEVSGFHLTYGLNRKKNRIELTIRDAAKRLHRATHTTFILLDDLGSLLERPAITPEVAQFIFEHFQQRGHTESFSIYSSDLQTRRLNSRDVTVSPESVRHVLGNAERSFTATGSKLAAHWPIFHKLRDTGYGSIIRATLTNHQVCSSHCHFCSTIARNRRDSVTLEEAKQFVEKLYFQQADYNREHFAKYNDEYRSIHGCDIRLRGLILSGGGQPNLWPHFTEFVQWLRTLDIDLGLITNGFPPKVPDEIYEAFTWVRISVTPEDASPFYPDGKFEKQPIPAVLLNNPNITVGYSYVDGPWTNDEMYLRLDNAAKENGFEYVRMLTDCNLGRTAQLQAHRDLAERLHGLGLVDENGKATSRIFHQLKYHGSDDEADGLWEKGQCYLQAYNVFWDTTGHEENGSSSCYACDSVTVLSDDVSVKKGNVSERKFNSSKWGTVKNTDVEKLFTEPLKSFFDPRSICRSCLFVRNNAAVKDLSTRENYDISVPAEIKHLNFP